MAVIEFDNVSKRYRLGQAGYRTFREDFLSLFKRMTSPGGKDENFIWALKDISFEVNQGEALGIIGPNGAGKTTILRLLAGITNPTKGRISVKGRIGVLIELSAGFHPELTGRENIYLNGSILGMSRKEISRKFDEIVDFAELEDFIDTPVKRYSSGMQVRLGFSVAAHIDPEVLLIDEVLAVGDISFQSKCMNKLAQMRERGVTTILISHNMHTVSGFSQKALYLNQGRVRYKGDVAKVIDLYKQDMAYGEKNGEKVGEFEFVPEDAIGSGLVRITKIQFLDEDENSITEIDAGSSLILRVHYQSEGYTGKVELDIGIRDANGNTFFQATNESYKKELVVVKKIGYFDISFKSICANNQRLLFFVTLWKYKRTELFDWKRELPFYVVGNPLSSGNVLLDVDWVVN